VHHSLAATRIPHTPSQLTWPVVPDTHTTTFCSGCQATSTMRSLSISSVPRCRPAMRSQMKIAPDCPLFVCGPHLVHHVTAV